jgi:prepilin-type N-terminal cleavage/methylation domain-containing protein
MKITAASKPFPRRAFTLIEIMIVVAIIGLIAAMGVPSILQTFRKEGMRKALSDVQDVLGDARAQAVLKGQTTEVVFHPAEKKIEGAGKTVELPADMDIAMLDINLMDFGGADVARVRFFPNGTCDEMVLVLHSGDDWKKISLEFSTALASVQPFKR